MLIDHRWYSYNWGYPILLPRSQDVASAKPTWTYLLTIPASAPSASCSSYGLLINFPWHDAARPCEAKTVDGRAARTSFKMFLSICSNQIPKRGSFTKSCPEPIGLKHWGETMELVKQAAFSFKFCAMPWVTVSPFECKLCVYNDRVQPFFRVSHNKLAII